MIRVLHVVTIMNRAGLENRLMDIYRNIDKTKIQFDFYTNREQPGEYDEEINSLGGKVFYSKPRHVFQEVKKVREFKHFLQYHPEYKIVHSHVNEWSTLFCMAAKKASVPIRIAHSRGANTSNSIKSVYKNIVKLPIKRYANKYFAVSKEAGVHLFGKKSIEYGIVEIIPNAINTEDFRFSHSIRERMRSEMGLLDKFVIMHVGNLTEAKNHIFLLEVFKAVHEKDEHAILVLVGDGPKRDKIEKWIKENKLESQILLLGKRRDVADLLQAADVFVFPSLHEGFPGAVLEAETAGLPCVISDQITKEIVLTDETVQISLNEAIQKWVELILKTKEINRKDNVEIIKNAGYDVKQLTSFLEHEYVMIAKECVLQNNILQC